MRAGDVVLQIGPAPVEGAAVLANEAAQRLGMVPPDLLELARQAIRDPGICIVEPALLAADLGARALHDPTEGGLSAGLHELAEASGLALLIDREAVLWFAPGRAVCTALGADPWGVLDPAGGFRRGARRACPGGARRRRPCQRPPGPRRDRLGRAHDRRQRPQTLRAGRGVAHPGIGVASSSCLAHLP
jgi:hypothetical protein